MPAIVIVLSFLILFLLTFLFVLLGPFLGLGFALWKKGRSGSASEPAACTHAQSLK
jgi:hypothetical protein